MPQAILPFKFEEEKHSGGMTSLAGLPMYLELSYVMGLTDSISRCLNVRDNGQGFKDHEMLMSLILLNLAGGNCVEDLKVLEGDEGLCRVLDRVKSHGMSRKQRRAFERRWRKRRTRTFPSSADTSTSGFRSIKAALTPAATVRLFITCCD